MKFCFYVTDASFEKLASERRDGNSLLRKLDLSHCNSFSGGVDKLFERPFFRGLRWLGVGHTCFDKKKDDFVAIKGMRPWLMVCYQGCEIGCEDGWQFHKGRFYKIHKSNVRLS
ncbi:hypothetical protein RD792_005916 [Penstemon davidsonii]|uniref:F-box/LRR-repeat protein 15-like leucin rich repeat domain-containing protein n=1 Tax=Penstemon davidsonii TaxID=160366 RepID=A0ABR0DF17_9LAMI|nr:hypothetical protein RD792_005916 [Penstemon davidsonii]